MAWHPDSAGRFPVLAGSLSQREGYTRGTSSRFPTSPAAGLGLKGFMLLTPPFCAGWAPSRPRGQMAKEGPGGRSCTDSRMDLCSEALRCGLGCLPYPLQVLGTQRRQESSSWWWFSLDCLGLGLANCSEKDGPWLGIS